MGYRRRHRSDANQREIVDALRAIGCRVYVIDQPLDLLISYRGKWLVADVKNRETGAKKTPAQAEFTGIETAPHAFLESIDEAIAFVQRETL